MWVRGVVILALCGTAVDAGAQTAAQTTVQVASDGLVQSSSQIVTAAGKLGKHSAYHPSRVLVKFKHGTRPGFLQGSGPAKTFKGDSSLYVVENPPGLSVPETLRRYAKHSDVLYAEPDYVLHTLDTIPTDPRWSEQWDMTQIAAPQAWDLQTDAHDVVVAVIDTGIDASHPDLQGNLWTNPVDGTHGFSCIGGVVSPGGLDDFGHGTHVAGTIGAAANNGLGIAGLNWQVQLLSLKFLDASGSGTTSDAVLCFDQATALKQDGVNIRVTNNSWGGGGFSQTLKDAMARAEAAGILHVCAAGNSAVNADARPMYPAAFDNRGIISVVATDANDVAAYFTNTGLASTDIAAPGVSTLSTVPPGTCPLCDASGYKLLSGTSMATPHVAGVMAALFHTNPSLTVDEARDVVLDPLSYDSLTNPRAATTTTGGRLNFFKTLNNPLVMAPALNGFPTLTVGADVTAAAGEQITLSASPSDPDNDQLRNAWAPLPSDAWLFGIRLSSLFPSPSGNPFTFTAPTLARDATVPYLAAVADGRGGSAQGTTNVTVLQSPLPDQPPAGALSVSPASGPVGTVVTVNFPVTDPEGGLVLWDVRTAQRNATSGLCCLSGSSYPLTLNTASAYRIRVQGIDPALNLSDSPSAVVHIGGAVGEPPVASAVVDQLSGPVPFTVHYDASASYDPDGMVQSFYVFCNGGGFASSGPATGTCVYDTPGAYDIFIIVADNDGYEDTAHLYVVALPSGVSVTPRPTATPSATRVATNTPTRTPSITPTTPPSPKPTVTQSPTRTLTMTRTATATRTPTRMASATPTRTPSRTPTPAPDLVEASVSDPPPTAARGAFFSVTDTVLNQGTAAAGASTTRYYLSTDAVRGGDKTLTGSRAVPGLAANVSSTGTVSVQVPSGTSVGTYFLLVCADDKKAVRELNEVNNCTASATTVQVK
jgi:subtilisin family serine protease